MTDQLRIVLVGGKEYGSYKMTVHRSYISIMEELSQTKVINRIWVVEGVTNRVLENDKDLVYNAFQFKDGIDLIDKLSPNLVCVFSDYEFLSRSLLLAAAQKDIPTVVLLSQFFNFDLLEIRRFGDAIRGRMHRLRARGLFVIKKYIFMLRTMKRNGYSFISLIGTFLRDFYLSISLFEPRYRFGGGDLNIVSTPAARDLLVKKGIERQKIVVTGDCGMDSLHEKLLSTNSRQTRMNRKCILLITDSMVEHGYWTNTERETVVTGIVRTILSNIEKPTDLRIKIHPRESIETYRRILKSIDSSVEILQEDDVVSLINDSAIIIGFGQTSAFFPAALLLKPIIIMNILNKDMKNNIFLSSNIAIECRNLNELQKIILQGDYKVPSKENLEKFIEKVLFRFDGKCSQRAAEAILLLLTTRRRRKQ